jgi:hypothetical protein
MRLAAAWTVVVFGLVTLGLTWAMGWHRELTISLHVAKTRWTAVVFGVTDVAASFVLIIYTWLDLKPHARLTVATALLISAVLTLLMIVGVVPHTTGWRARVHQRCAWLAAALIVVSALALTIDGWAAAPTWLRLLNVAFTAYGLSLALRARRPTLRHSILYSETALFFGFLLIVILAG